MKFKKNYIYYSILEIFLFRYVRRKLILLRLKVINLVLILNKKFKKLHFVELDSN